MLTLESIHNSLDRIAASVDHNKCVASVDFINDGIALRIDTFDVHFCPVKIEVTPFVFDINVTSRFNESDISHDEFSYFDVVMSIAYGRVCLKKRSGILFSRRAYLEVYVPSSGVFHINSGSLISRKSHDPGDFKSYLLNSP